MPIKNLSGYEIMWIIVMFDLPTNTKKERHQATKFRSFLLDNSFEMSQYSVYMRWVVGYESFNAVSNKIKNNSPDNGRVHILKITDKQFADTITIECAAQARKRENPKQLELF